MNFLHSHGFIFSYYLPHPRRFSSIAFIIFPTLYFISDFFFLLTFRGHFLLLIAVFYFVRCLNFYGSIKKFIIILKYSSLILLKDAISRDNSNCIILFTKWLLMDLIYKCYWVIYLLWYMFTSYLEIFNFLFYAVPLFSLICKHFKSFSNVTVSQ